MSTPNSWPALTTKGRVVYRVKTCGVGKNRKSICRHSSSRRDLRACVVTVANSHWRAVVHVWCEEEWWEREKSCATRRNRLEKRTSTTKSGADVTCTSTPPFPAMVATHSFLYLFFFFYFWTSHYKLSIKRSENLHSVVTTRR